MRRRSVGYRSEQSGMASLQKPLLADEDDESPNSSVTGNHFSPYVSAPSSHSKYLENKVWQDNFVNLVAQWVAWFGQMMKGASTVMANLGGTVLELLQIKINSQIEPPFVLTPSQEENLGKLKERLSVPFNGALEEHQEALRALWRVSYPDVKLSAMVSPQWKEMGWQGTDPSTDFRGGGYISLENLLNFAYRYPTSFRRILNKENGERAEWEYPFAVAGLNLTFMLAQLLDLRAEVPSSAVGRKFVQFLGEDEKAFDVLYCVAFEMLDAQWLQMRASYMEFNAVLDAVKAQIERALKDSTVQSVTQVPSYQQLLRN